MGKIVYTDAIPFGVTIKFTFSEDIHVGVKTEDLDKYGNDVIRYEDIKKEERPAVTER